MNKWDWGAFWVGFCAEIAASMVIFGLFWAAKTKVFKVIGDFLDACRRQKIKDHKDAKQEH